MTLLKRRYYMFIRREIKKFVIFLQNLDFHLFENEKSSNYKGVLSDRIHATFPYENIKHLQV